MTRKRQLAAALDQAKADNRRLDRKYADADQAAQWFWQRWLGAVADGTQWRHIASTQLARIGVVLSDNQRLTADRHRLAADNRLLRRIRLQLSAENRRLREQRDALAEQNERFASETETLRAQIQQAPLRLVSPRGKGGKFVSQQAVGE